MQPRKQKNTQGMVHGKVVLVGNSAVGKTNLMLAFTDDNYKSTHVATIGVDFRVKTLELGSHSVRMQLWDTAGQEKFVNIASVYYRKASAIVFVYSVTNRKSFQDVQKWMRMSEEVEEARCKFIVGNKMDCCDAQREVSRDEGERLATQLNCQFL